MSSDNLEIPFQRVTRKNRKTKLNYKVKAVEIPEPLTEEEKSKAIRRIEAAKEDISESNFFKSVTSAVKEGLGILDKTAVTEIICLGLGKVCECLIPKYQLAVLLCLSDIYKIEVKVFDPVFTVDDRFILEKFNVKILSENLEGKYIAGQKTTIFFLPHCPKQLTNNILWSNWGLNLSSCILICNSFCKIIEQNSEANLLKGVNYIREIFPHTDEIIIENSFKYDDIFNDTSLHVFPLKKLNSLPTSFWESRIEPYYREEDIEFIRRKLSTVDL